MDTHRSLEATRDELTAARDHARLKIHLLSRDARDTWNELETRIESLEHTFKEQRGKMPKQTWKKIQETRDAVQGFMNKHFKRSPALSDRARDVMTATVYSCRPSDELQRAASIMWNQDCGAVPVVDDEERLVGIITDRDICMAAYTQGSALGGLKVSAAMARDVATCGPDDTIAHVLGLMVQRRVRRIPVVGQDGTLAGMLALGGLATHLIGSDKSATASDACAALAQTLAAISRPWASEGEQAAAQ